jgi:hypothetical protein
LKYKSSNRKKKHVSTQGLKKVRHAASTNGRKTEEGIHEEIKNDTEI